jgi:D-3-phosphoglycerate dehydrogenase / 2-oxoglutarate reductase
VRIVATDEVPAVAHDAFAPLGEIVIDGAPGARALVNAEVLIVRGTPLDASVLDRAGSLRAVARTGAGYDNIDVDEATRRGVPIVYAPGVGSQPVAEGTVALILAAAKRVRQLGQVVGEGDWSARYDVTGLDLDGACLGVVGLGAIGTRVARLCGALGMRVVACDPAARPGSRPEAELVSLSELVARADVITLHCALTAETRGLVDATLLSKLRPGAVLVNVARGELVASEEALADALGSGRLSAVALDVFPHEPPDPRHRLYSDPRVICTPHAVGLTRRWNEEVFRALASGVQSVLRGERPANLLNPEALRAH